MLGAQPLVDYIVNEKMCCSNNLQFWSFMIFIAEVMKHLILKVCIEIELFLRLNHFLSTNTFTIQVYLSQES